MKYSDLSNQKELAANKEKLETPLHSASLHAGEKENPLKPMQSDDFIDIPAVFYEALTCAYQESNEDCFQKMISSTEFATTFISLMGPEYLAKAISEYVGKEDSSIAFCKILQSVIGSVGSDSVSRVLQLLEFDLMPWMEEDVVPHKTKTPMKLRYYLSKLNDPILAERYPSYRVISKTRGRDHLLFKMDPDYLAFSGLERLQTVMSQKVAYKQVRKLTGIDMAASAQHNTIHAAKFPPPSSYWINTFDHIARQRPYYLQHRFMHPNTFKKIMETGRLESQHRLESHTLKPSEGLNRDTDRMLGSDYFVFFGLGTDKNNLPMLSNLAHDSAGSIVFNLKAIEQFQKDKLRTMVVKGEDWGSSGKGNIIIPLTGVRINIQREARQKSPSHAPINTKTRRVFVYRNDKTQFETTYAIRMTQEIAVGAGYRHLVPDLIAKHLRRLTEEEQKILFKTFVLALSLQDKKSINATVDEYLKRFYSKLEASIPGSFPLMLETVDSIKAPHAPTLSLIPLRKAVSSGDLPKIKQFLATYPELKTYDWIIMSIHRIAEYQHNLWSKENLPTRQFNAILSFIQPYVQSISTRLTEQHMIIPEPLIRCRRLYQRFIGSEHPQLTITTDQDITEIVFKAPPTMTIGLREFLKGIRLNNLRETYTELETQLRLTLPIDKDEALKMLESITDSAHKLIDKLRQSESPSTMKTIGSPHQINEFVKQLATNPKPLVAYLTLHADDVTRTLNTLRSICARIPDISGPGLQSALKDHLAQNQDFQRILKNKNQLRQLMYLAAVDPNELDEPLRSLIKQPLFTAHNKYTQNRFTATLRGILVDDNATSFNKSFLSDLLQNVPMRRLMVESVGYDHRITYSPLAMQRSISAYRKMSKYLREIALEYDFPLVEKLEMEAFMDETYNVKAWADYRHRFATLHKLIHKPMIVDGGEKKLPLHYSAQKIIKSGIFLSAEFAHYCLDPRHLQSILKYNYGNFLDKFIEIVDRIERKAERCEPSYEAAGKVLFHRLKLLEYELYKDAQVTGNDLEKQNFTYGSRRIKHYVEEARHKNRTTQLSV